MRSRLMANLMPSGAVEPTASTLLPNWVAWSLPQWICRLLGVLGCVAEPELVGGIVGNCGSRRVPSAPSSNTVASLVVAAAPKVAVQRFGAWLGKGSGLKANVFDDCQAAVAASQYWKPVTLTPKPPTLTPVPGVAVPWVTRMPTMPAVNGAPAWPQACKGPEGEDGAGPELTPSLGTVAPPPPPPSLGPLGLGTVPLPSLGTVLPPPPSLGTVPLLVDDPDEADPELTLPLLPEPDVDPDEDPVVS